MVGMMEDFVDLPLHSAGVYLLWWEGRVVYVGQSRNVFSRLSRHRCNYQNWLNGRRVQQGRSQNENRVIKFDRASVKFCRERDLDKLELELIEKFITSFCGAGVPACDQSGAVAASGRSEGGCSEGLR